MPRRSPLPSSPTGAARLSRGSFPASSVPSRPARQGSTRRLEPLAPTPRARQRSPARWPPPAMTSSTSPSRSSRRRRMPRRSPLPSSPTGAARLRRGSFPGSSCPSRPARQVSTARLELLSPTPGASQRSPARCTVTSVPSGNTVSECAASSTRGPLPRPVSANTLPSSSRVASSPASVHSSCSSCARACSPKGGAGTSQMRWRSSPISAVSSRRSVSLMFLLVSVLQGGDSLAQGIKGCLGPVVEPQLRKYFRQPVADCLFTYFQHSGYFLVRLTLGEQPQNFRFPFTQFSEPVLRIHGQFTRLPEFVQDFRRHFRVQERLSVKIGRAHV